METNDLVIMKLDTARMALAEARTIQETKKILDISSAAEIYAKRQKLGEEAIGYATEIKLEALRQLGNMLKETERSIGTRGQLKGKNISGSTVIEPPDHTPPTLDDLGIDKKISSLSQKIADLTDEEFETIKAATNITKVFKNHRMNEEKDKIEKRNDDLVNIEIRKGDFKEVLDDVYEIDAIITDPPYPKEYIQCFSDLSMFANKHLKNDGFVVIYSGQYHLPEVIKRLSEHLTYVWTFCLYHIGKKQLVNGVNIMCGWKPVLIFSRGRKKMRFSAYDVLISEQREKYSHEWQQSESGVASLVDIFSKPNELIVDPFCGSGTFGIVSQKLGRRFIGAEIK